MKTQRILLILTVINLLILTVILLGSYKNTPSEVQDILRGRALELVDDRNQVRAEIKVLPAQPDLKMPDGTTGYPEVVQLRLITSEGGPNVKLVTTEDGSGLVLGGESGYIQILSRDSLFLNLARKDGMRRVIRP